MKSLNTVHLNGLRAVEAAGRLGSLQAAAAELGVTAGAVSQHIIKTEKQLGRVLFNRTPRGLVQTEFAGSFLARLGTGFETLDQAVSLARRRDETILTISVAPVFAARWLVSRIDSFTARHPNIRLRIDATTQLVNLESSGIDLGIRVGRGDWPGVRSELLLAQEVFPVCAPDMAARIRAPADLLSFPVVIDAHAMFSWEVWLRDVGLSGAEMKVGHIFNEASLCIDAAVAGQGVFLAWQTLAGYPLLKGTLVAPFTHRAVTGFAHYFVTPADRRDSRIVAAFKQWMRDELDDSMRRIFPIPVPASGPPSSP